MKVEEEKQRLKLVANRIVASLLSTQQIPHPTHATQQSHLLAVGNLLKGGNNLHLKKENHAQGI